MLFTDIYHTKHSKNFPQTPSPLLAPYGIALTILYTFGYSPILALNNSGNRILEK